MRSRRSYKERTILECRERISSLLVRRGGVNSQNRLPETGRAPLRRQRSVSQDRLDFAVEKNNPRILEA